MKRPIQTLLLVGLVILSIVLSPTAHAFASSARKALVIGNDSYPGNSLKNARNDATAIADGLSSLGYSVTLFLDLDTKGFNSAVEMFTTSLQTGDVAVVYYAGHGLQVDGENYLVPTDFHVSDEVDVKAQGYALSSLLNKISLHGASTEIVILDACRNNPFMPSRSLHGGWASTATSAGSFLAFGTAPGSTASDDSQQGHGLFTQSLLKFLDSPLDVEQMFQEVRADVIGQSAGRQVPWTASSLIGSLHLIPKLDEEAPVILAALPVGDRDALKAGRSVSPTGNVVSAEALRGTPEIQRLLVNAQSEMRGLHLSQALTILSDVISIDPRCSLALRLLAIVLHLTGQSARSIEVLDRAIELDPQDASAYSYRCLIKASQQIYGFEADCENALNRSSTSPEAHLGVGIKLLLDGDSTGAYNEVSAGILSNGVSATLFSLRGDIAASRQREDLAHSDHLRATQIVVERTSP